MNLQPSQARCPNGMYCYLFGEYLSQIEPDYSHQTFHERVDEAW